MPWVPCGPAVHAAWERWLGDEGDPRERLGRDAIETSRHLPLLYTSLHRAGVSIDPRLPPYLRTALLREELRHRRYERVTREALAALAAARVDVVVVKGAALAATVFAPASLRHCHDLDLLVSVERLDAAVRALAARGFSASSDARAALGAGVAHPSGLPVMLHTRLVTMPGYTLPSSAMLARTGVITVAGVPARAVSATDMLGDVAGGQPPRGHLRVHPRPLRFVASRVRRGLAAGSGRGDQRSLALEKAGDGPPEAS